MRLALQARTSEFPFAAAIVATFLVLAASVNSTSFWIDEGFSAWVASHTTLGGLLQSLREGDSSDLQMLLYNLYLWVWAHIFGTSEYSLRAANLPFAALFVSALALTSKLAFQRSWAWIAIALSPFVWGYTNEARAYMAMLACATASAGAFLIYVYGPVQCRRWAPWITLISLTVALLLHMLAAFLIPAIAVIAVAEKRTWKRDWIKPLIVFIPILGIVGAYFVWTLTRGEGYEYGAPTPLRFVYVVYEFLGFTGLGPSRDVLRLGLESSTLLPYWLPLLTGGAGLCFALTGPWTRQARVLLLSWSIAFGCAIAAGLMIQSRFLGRHVSALLPLLLFFLVVKATGRYRIAALALIWAISDARLSLLPEYRKDDYRSATHFAISESQRTGASIAWAGDPLTANYYGLHLTDDRVRPAFYFFDYNAGLTRVPWAAQASGVVAGNWDPAKVESFMRTANKPVLLALSKPDLYDVHGGWSPWLRVQQPIAVFQNFQIYLLR